MSPDPISTGSEIAVIKVQLDAVAVGLSSLRDFQNAQFGALSTKFDIVSDLIRDMTRMQEKQTAHGTGLERAFSDIKTLSASCDATEREHLIWVATHEKESLAYRDQAIAERDTWRGEHAAEHVQISRKYNTGAGWVLGAGAVMAVFVSLIAWAGDRAISTLDDTAKAANQNELNLLQYKLEQAQKRVGN